MPCGWNRVSSIDLSSSRSCSRPPFPSARAPARREPHRPRSLLPSRPARSRSPRPTDQEGRVGRSAQVGPAPLPPLRSDAPGRLGAAPAALPELDSVDSRAEAVRALECEVYAASSLRKQTTFWNTILKALGKWSLDPMPPSREKLLFLGAALKMGRYSTADQYLSHYKLRSEREGFAFGPALHRTFLDVVRSCKRGVGGPVQALALPLMRLGELDLQQDEPWTNGGPVGPASAIIAGAWFLTREVELSTTRARLVSLELGQDGQKVVRWHLPASKTDVEARGVSRAHGCGCIPGAPVRSCPFCAISSQLARLRRLFAGRWKDGVADIDLPLFPTAEGFVVSKDKMAETIVLAAKKLGVPTEAPDASSRVSGHSLRVTGAQGLARAGVEVWAIQLLGRWGSDTVLQYVREVPLELSASWAARASRSHALDELLRDRALRGSADAPAIVVPPSPSSSSLVLCPSTRSALTEALDEAAAAANVASEPLTACSFVTSESGKWHRLASSGLSGSSASWTSACGWRFAGSLASLSSELPKQLCHKVLCARCFPELRERLKRET